MWLVVLGGCGAWPTAEQACSGYLVEYAGFRLLIDPGYATLPRLLAYGSAEAVDAVLVSHGHPDHCADLNPLLRARALGGAPGSPGHPGHPGHPGSAGGPLPPLPVYAPYGALDAVLSLDRPGMLADAYDLREFRPGDRFDVGPFAVGTWLLPHFVPNAGIRLTTPEAVLAYTGDTGPSPRIARLAEGADLLLSEATYVHRAPAADAPYLLTARLAGEYARQAGVDRLLLTHLWPGTDPEAAREAATEAFGRPLGVVRAGLVTRLGSCPPDAGS